MAREVTLNFDATQASDFSHKTDPVEFEKAIGYLSTWNFTYSDVFISLVTPIVSDCEITAVFFNREDEDEDDNEYVIVAVWEPNSKRFSFHS